MAKAPTEPEAQPERAGLISVAQAAQLLMVTEQWIRQLVKKGYIQKPERGRVALVGAVQGYIRFLKEEERRTSKSAAASAVQQARADEINLRIAREQSKLIEVEEAIAMVDEIVGTLRTEFSGMPERVSRVRFTTPRALRDRIEHEVDQNFGRASRTLDERGAAIRSGGSAYEDTTEDDA